jgi:hypothetical protein
VVDPNYLANPGIYFSPSDPLRFEKAMLEDWFRGDLVINAPQQAFDDAVAPV